MQTAPTDNLERYESSDVVSFYERETELQPTETYLFDKYLKPGLVVLDMGVGGGRTTPRLARDSARYVGADYSNGMVEVCQRRFPSLEFVRCDARDLGRFGEGEFDAIVFSFNGIDMVGADEGRARCLSEAARVLKHGGIFIFSSHNARILATLPSLRNARPHQLAWRSIRSVLRAPRIAFRSLSSGAFRKGEGYVLDPVHGGLHTYVSTPSTIAPQLAAAGFTLLEVVGGPNPEVKSQWFTPWHYYVCRKL